MVQAPRRLVSTRGPVSVTAHPAPSLRSAVASQAADPPNSHFIQSCCVRFHRVAETPLPPGVCTSDIMLLRRVECLCYWQALRAAHSLRGSLLSLCTPTSSNRRERPLLCHAYARGVKDFRSGCWVLARRLTAEEAVGVRGGGKELWELTRSARPAAAQAT